MVKRQLSEVKKKTRSEARQKQTKQDKVSDLKFVTTYKFITNYNYLLRTYNL